MIGGISRNNLGELQAPSNVIGSSIWIRRLVGWLAGWLAGCWLAATGWLQMYVWLLCPFLLKFVVALLRGCCIDQGACISSVCCIASSDVYSSLSFLASFFWCHASSVLQNICYVFACGSCTYVFFRSGSNGYNFFTIDISPMLRFSICRNRCDFPMMCF